MVYSQWLQPLEQRTFQKIIALQGKGNYEEKLFAWLRIVFTKVCEGRADTRSAPTFSPPFPEIFFLG